MRRAELVIVCGGSDLCIRIASNQSEGGSSNMSRVAVDQIAEHHCYGQGTAERQKQLLL